MNVARVCVNGLLIFTANKALLRLSLCHRRLYGGLTLMSFVVFVLSGFVKGCREEWPHLKGSAGVSCSFLGDLLLL